MAVAGRPFSLSFLELPRSGIGVRNCIYQLWCGVFLFVNIIAPMALSAGTEIQTVS